MIPVVIGVYGIVPKGLELEIRKNHRGYRDDSIVKISHNAENRTKDMKRLAVT